MFEIALVVMLTTKDGGAQIKYIPMIKTSTVAIFKSQKRNRLNNCEKLGRAIVGNITGRYISKNYKCVVLNGG